MRLAACLLIALTIASCGDDTDGANAERQRAIDAARDTYATAISSGLGLEHGPCIAEELTSVPGWSVDIAHDPRQDIDNDPANQCQAYREGETEHFVELTPEGKLIRAK